MKKIIAFEGMPGAGKTTIIRKITEESLLKKCIGIPQLEISQKPYDLKDGLIMSKLYLNAERQKSNRINDFLRKYDYILLDRTFLTTLAYCYARSKIENQKAQYIELLNYFSQKKEKGFLIKPTHIICFSLSIRESILRRLEFSKIEEYHYWFDPEFLYYFSKFYNKQNLAKFKIPKITFINVLKLSKDVLIEKIIKVIQENKNEE
jgi:thymidylate kinase